MKRRNEKPTAPNRPASFDARVLAYTPGLRNLSHRLLPPSPGSETQADLVTDTIILALHRWGSFREDGGMWNWLAYTMRSLARDRRNQWARIVRTVDDADGIRAGRIGIAPAQEDYVMLSSVLKELTGRKRDMVLRRAAGDELCEIANDHGISKQRVQQIVEKERARLRIGEAA